MKRRFLSTVFIIGFLFISVSGLMAQNKYYSVPLDAFHGITESEDYCQCRWLFTGTWIHLPWTWITKPDSGGYLVADIELPQGDIMRGFNLLYYDNGTAYIRVEVIRKNVWLAAYPEVIFSYQTTGAADFLRSAGEWTNLLGGDGRQVKNQIFAYSVRIYISYSGGTTKSNLYGVYGIRIVYF